MVNEQGTGKETSQLYLVVCVQSNCKKSHNGQEHYLSPFVFLHNSVMVGFFLSFEMNFRSCSLL